MYTFFRSYLPVEGTYPCEFDMMSLEDSMAVMREKVVIPTRIHKPAKQRPTPDLGTLSPYPTVVMLMKDHQHPLIQPEKIEFLLFFRFFEIFFSIFWFFNVSPIFRLFRFFFVFFLPTYIDYLDLSCFIFEFLIFMQFFGFFQFFNFFPILMQFFDFFFDFYRIFFSLVFSNFSIFRFFFNKNSLTENHPNRDYESWSSEIFKKLVLDQSDSNLGRKSVQNVQDFVSSPFPRWQNRTWGWKTNIWAIKATCSDSGEPFFPTFVGQLQCSSKDSVAEWTGWSGTQTFYEPVIVRGNLYIPVIVFW